MELPDIQAKIAQFRQALVDAANALNWWRTHRAGVLARMPGSVAAGDAAASTIETARDTYAWLTGKIDEIANWISSVSGGSLSGLGILPAIPVAYLVVIGVVATAIAVFASATVKIYQIKKQYDALQSGKTLPVAPTWLSDLGSNVMFPLAILGVLYLFLTRKKSA